jgi:phosphoribosylglycinamide formyltransferase-1
MKNIAIFASGSGSNAENLSLYFRNHPEMRVVLILSNNSGAFVLERAKKLGIPSQVFTRTEFASTSNILHILNIQHIDYIVLAGFLLLIPAYLIQAFPDKILNIHPALLPQYGGKGMYGMNVHESVIAAGETESGISIHLVNEYYDEGRILFQAKCQILPNESPDSLAMKIHELEYKYFPTIVENYIQKNK